MAMISYGRIQIMCPECGTVQMGALYAKKGLFDLQAHIRWSNAHGVEIRLFCGSCGTVHDCKDLYKSDNVEIEKLSWTTKKIDYETMSR